MNRFVASWRVWSEQTDTLGRRRIPPRPLFVAYGLVVNAALACGALFPREAPLLHHAVLGFVLITLGLLGTGAVQWAVRAARGSVSLRQGTALVANALIYGGLLAYVDGASQNTMTITMLVLFAFFVSAHAFQYRVSARAPWFLVPLVLVLGTAAVVDDHDWLLYLLTSLWLIPACVVLGNAGARLDAALESEARLRQEHATLLLELRERENARLTEFIDRLAGHTHDLGGPALALSAALDRLDAASPEIAAATAPMARDLRALIGMITEAKGEVRRVGLPPLEPAAVEESVLAVAERIRLRYPQRVIDVRTGPAVSVEVRGGTLALARAVENVASNAAAAAARCVRLSWRAADDGIVVVIEDDGPGMPAPADLAPGGLGLSSARRVIETSGGEVTITRSSDLRGAEVRLGCRLARDDDRETAARRAPSHALRLRTAAGQL